MPDSQRALKHSLWLASLFVLSMPLMNPWVRGDGVGYYAFARAPLIEHSLDFQHDYQSANDSFRDARLDENGSPKSEFRTATGHLDNHFTVGPAILWSPFLLAAHAGVSIARAFGSHVTPDGFSAPYRFAMAFATALYGFAGLLLSASLARKYVDARWAFLATVAIWWGSSLPVYMYFNPSWSHAHSAFAVALFLWYWQRTRLQRGTLQWCVLAATAGLMLNVYYANAMVLMVLVVDAIREYATAFGVAPDRKTTGTETNHPSPHGVGPDAGFDRQRNVATAFSPEAGNSVAAARLFANHLLFGAILILCMLPTFITRAVVYGSPFASGYIPLRDWAWRSPYFLAVLFSANHGLFAWTPLLLLATAGLLLLWRRQPRAGTPILAAVLAFYLFIACYPDWAGISSYGNRFFVSLTPPFILGLSVLLDRCVTRFRSPRVAAVVASSVLACFVVWNLAFIFQWGTHLVPARGPVVWSEMVHNQWFVVPREISGKVGNYLFHRASLMRQIENRDIEQLNKQPAP
jgi:hypothetical protein